LNDGKVFVEGGSKVIAGVYYTVSTAEVYDPTTGLWSFTSNAMSTGRDDSGLVKLNDGRLVIIGGAGDDGNYNPKASIEIFDPTTNLFTVQTYAMITPRAGHRATLLQNGKILVTGGDWGNGGNTGEIIDPIGGTVLATGNVMNDARFYHSSILLGDGTVLIAGGSYATAPADIYDPATNLFTATASTMTNSRVMHQATLLSDGTVLISGGHYYSGLAWGSGILVSRGSLEHYNPATKTFTPVGRMDTARWGHMDVLINGKVYMFGGNNGYDLADISVY
jgi:N-acetylneuraminic acid mutarotase